MGFVFQGAALFDSLSVYENVAYPLREHTSLGEAEIRERVVRNLSLVGLGSEVLALLPAELSGGMKKRVGIARALSVEPEVLLFDEPTGGLDPTNAKLVGELIRELRAGVCDTAIVVTHDIELDRKSTRLNSSHDQISYAVFCLKKKTHIVRKASLASMSTSV